MRSRLLFVVLSLIFTVVSCKTANVSTIPNVELRLVERVKEFQSYISTMDCKSAWEMRSESFKKRFSEESYKGYLNTCKRDILGDYEIIYLDIRDSRAKVKTMHSPRMQGSDENLEIENYSYWIFERGKWYLAETGITSTKADWW